jgi:hypothetical protein
MSNKIGIVILATNAYFVLGVRFIKKFMHHYKGESEIKFYFFSDDDPQPYLENNINVEHHFTEHKSWVDGTNAKFLSILSLANCDSDYLYYFDADTNVSKNFTADWFLGDLVGGEHYGNRGWLANGAGFDRFEKSKAYVPVDTPLPCTYYYGAFFGGKKENVIDFCKTLREWQLEDRKIPYEPGVNDESYINAYFHYNPPVTVPLEKFAFDISDKGGIGETRNMQLDISALKQKMLDNKSKIYDIRQGDLFIHDNTSNS